MIVKLDDLPKVRGENKRIFQTNTYANSTWIVWSNNPPAQDSSGIFKGFFGDSLLKME